MWFSPEEHLETYLNNAIHNLNHNPKKRMNGVNLFHAYFSYEKVMTGKKNILKIY